MKGRILFALLFAALMALGIAALDDIQLESSRLPVQSRLTAFITAVPAPEAPAAPENVQTAEKSAVHAPSVPLQAPRIAYRETAPVLMQSYYLAHYQAFHYSDRAG